MCVCVACEHPNTRQADEGAGQQAGAFAPALWVLAHKSEDKGKSTPRFLCGIVRALKVNLPRLGYQGRPAPPRQQASSTSELLSCHTETKNTVGFARQYHGEYGHCHGRNFPLFLDTILLPSYLLSCLYLVVNEIPHVCECDCFARVCKRSGKN